MRKNKGFEGAPTPRQKEIVLNPKDGVLEDKAHVKADENEKPVKRKFERTTAERDALMLEIVELRPALKGYAMSLTHNANDADDLVQTALEKAFKALDTFEPDSNLRALLFVILRNTFMTAKTRDAKMVPTDLSVAEAYINASEEHPGLGPVDISVDQDMRERLKTTLDNLETLSGEQREALLLIAQGFSYDEMAAILNVNIGTVKSRVSRARVNLSNLEKDVN